MANEFGFFTPEKNFEAYLIFIKGIDNRKVHKKTLLAVLASVFYNRDT